MKITEDNTDDIMDDLCELVSNLYINDDITNLRDINSCMFRVEKKKCTNFIEGKLQKTITDVIDIEVPKMVAGMYNDVKGYNNDTKKIS